MLLALDVALLLPSDVRRRAVALSAALPAEESHGLLLDDTHLPHITLTQMFAREDELAAVYDRVDETRRGVGPLRLTVSGAVKSGAAVWMAIEPTPELQRLHEALMDALRGLERPGGTPHAFFGEHARVSDVLWVTGYRLKASFGAFRPHVTLGHATAAPVIAPFTFVAETVAVCHLGRFCSCREIKRAWTLG